MKSSYQELFHFLVNGELENKENSIFNKGFAQLKALQYDPNSDQWPKHFEPYRKSVEKIHNAIFTRYSNGQHVLYNLKQLSLSSFFTPSSIAQAIVSAISNQYNITSETTILEPSAGTGNILKTLPTSSITALEPDPLSFDVLQLLHPNTQCHNLKLEEFKTNQLYDIIISNIPFGNIKVFDQSIYDTKNKDLISSCTKIHNYFFAKALQLTKNNGIIAFITTNAFLDSPTNQSLLKYIGENAKLLGFIRLPNSVFSTTGTHVTTDVLILKKGKSQSNLHHFDTLSLDTEVTVNKLIKNHPEYVLGTSTSRGQYGQVSHTVNSDLPIETVANTLQQSLISQFQNAGSLTPSLNYPTNESKNKYQTLPEHINTYPLQPGHLIVYQQKIFRLINERHIETVQIPNTNRTQNILDIRNTLLKLREFQSTNYNHSKEIERLSNDLRQLYFQFTFQYGYLHETANYNIITQDKNPHNLLGLEKRNGQTYEPSDLLLGISTKQKETRQLTLQEAIFKSLNFFQKINPSYMEEALQMPFNDIFKKGFSEELLFLSYEDDTWQFVTKDLFLSGNIYEKIESTKNQFPKQFSQYQVKHLTKLEETIPTPVPFELIDINLGERWIKTNIYQKFIEYFFDTTEVTISYIQSLDKYKIEVPYDNTIDRTEWAIQGRQTIVRGKTLVEHAFTDSTPTITYTITEDGEQKRLSDTPAIKQAINIIKKIAETFTLWLYQPAQSNIKDELTTTYNKLFNAIKPRFYDGSHLQFDKLQNFSPYPTQQNAVYRNLQQLGGLNDHKVGAGKTVIMAITAFEMKRLSLANKPLIIAKTANVTSIYKECKKAYPLAKIIHPQTKDLTPKNRPFLFEKIMNNHWDMVIISHDQFKMIPQSLTIKKQLLQEELNALEIDLETATEEEGGPTYRQMKGLRKKAQNLTSKIQELDYRIQRDNNLIDFDKMGFDHIMVDESHSFKNLMYTTRHNRVSGLGNPAGSQKAFNLLIACRTIQLKHGNKDKGITFLSGTPISNSLVELYLLFKYLKPNALKKQHINSFDAWAKVYAKKSYDYEFTVSNEIKQKERFRTFIKVPELAAFYTSFTDVVNKQNFKTDEPNLKHHIIPITPTPDQEDFIDRLITFAKQPDGQLIFRGPLTESEKKAYMLIATNTAKKMSLDMRLIDSSFEDHPRNKVNVASQKINEIYQRFNEHLGTQIIFCDQSIPNPNKFNIYDELRLVLTTQYHIPTNEIAYIHHYKTSKQRQQLYRDMNDGIIRILIGSTEKCGVGLNVQKRITAMHHLDIPWRPSDLDQRTGRGARPGNIIAKMYNENTVDNYVYAVEKSLDSYQFNILQNKQKFIDQIKNNSIEARSIDEGAMNSDDDGDTMDFAEYVALLSGNQNLLKRTKVNQKIQDLQRQKEHFIQQQSNDKRKITSLQQKHKHNTKWHSNLIDDKHLVANLYQNPDPISTQDNRFHYPKPVILNNVQYYDCKKIGYTLQEINKTGQLNTITGHFGPFQILYKSEKDILGLQSPSGIFYTFQNGHLNDNPTLAGKYFHLALNKIDSLISNCNKELQFLTNEIDALQRKVQQTFSEEKKLQNLKIELQKLDEDIEIDMSSIPVQLVHKAKKHKTIVPYAWTNIKYSDKLYSIKWKITGCS